MRGAALVLLLCAGLAGLLPAAALAQSAGDEQYSDPFQEQPQGDQAGGGGGGQAGGGGGGQAGGGGGGQAEGGGGGQAVGGGGGSGETGGSSQSGTTSGSTGSTAVGGTTETTPPTSTGVGGDGTGVGGDTTATAGTTSSGASSAVLPVTGLPAVVPLFLLGAGLLAAGVAIRREV
jgi:hypothetical protein